MKKTAFASWCGRCVATSSAFGSGDRNLYCARRGRIQVRLEATLNSKHTGQVTDSGRLSGDRWWKEVIPAGTTVESCRRSRLQAV
jgi:hypothetical protein